MCFLRENEFTERLWGRIPLESGAALYFFQRRSPLQRALHRLKYHRQAHIGLQLGRLLGGQLKRSPFFRRVEAVVPVPLHPDKQQVRGYNQSALIASGVSEAMGIPAFLGALERRRFSESQTRKRRMERFDNVAEVFVLAQPGAVAGKHILLVDDVLTTGATLEACGRALVSAPDVRLSMATVAIATTRMR
ncbi:MAG: phosphoribosyltransferase family protein [Saprospiraceae bacterium]|nr:phosphoribosyltransferase family protein [Saprospiraceae bacterium]